MTAWKAFLEELVHTDEFNQLRPLLSTFAAVLAASVLIGLTLYILRAIGVYTMAKAAKIPAAWLAFVPVANLFPLGAIAEKYTKRDGTKSAKFGLILLLLEILQRLLLVAFCVLAVLRGIKALELLAENHEWSIPEEAINTMLPVVFLLFLIAFIGFAELIIRYVALYRVFAIFSYENAGLFTALSVVGMLFLSDILEPVFLFIVRKNAPVFDYRERLNRFTVNQNLP